MMNDFIEKTFMTTLIIKNIVERLQIKVLQKNLEMSKHIQFIDVRIFTFIIIAYILKHLLSNHFKGLGA